MTDFRVYNEVLPTPQETRAPVVLYYKLRLVQSDPLSDNAVRLDFIPYIPNSTYSGLSIRYMSNATYTEYNQDTIEFIGYRTRQGPPPLDIPPYYTEQVQITLKEGGYVNAQSVYQDGGSGFETTIPFVDYTVLGASGSLTGAKRVRIVFDHINAYRVVYVYF